MPEINYHVTTSALNVTRTIRYSPIKGIINSAIIWFPSGCEGLVEVFINIGTKQILPYPAQGSGGDNTGIALDSTIQSFSIDEYVDKNNPIEVKINNHDSLKEHLVVVILKVLREQTYTGP